MKNKIIKSIFCMYSVFFKVHSADMPYHYIAHDLGKKSILEHYDNVPIFSFTFYENIVMIFGMKNRHLRKLCFYNMNSCNTNAYEALMPIVENIEYLDNLKASEKIWLKYQHIQAIELDKPFENISLSTKQDEDRRFNQLLFSIVKNDETPCSYDDLITTSVDKKIKKSKLAYYGIHTFSWPLRNIIDLYKTPENDYKKADAMLRQALLERSIPCVDLQSIPLLHNATWFRTHTDSSCIIAQIFSPIACHQQEKTHTAIDLALLSKLYTYCILFDQDKGSYIVSLFNQWASHTCFTQKVLLYLSAICASHAIHKAPIITSSMLKLSEQLTINRHLKTIGFAALNFFETLTRLLQSQRLRLIHEPYDKNNSVIESEFVNTIYKPFIQQCLQNNEIQNHLKNLYKIDKEFFNVGIKASLRRESLKKTLLIVLLPKDIDTTTALIAILPLPILYIIADYWATDAKSLRIISQFIKKIFTEQKTESTSSFTLKNVGGRLLHFMRNFNH